MGGGVSLLVEVEEGEDNLISITLDLEEGKLFHSHSFSGSWRGEKGNVILDKIVFC
jgi:hypothetical protein